MNSKVIHSERFNLICISRLDSKTPLVFMATGLLLRIYRRHILSKSTNRNRPTSPFRGRSISDEGTKDLREIGERFWGLRKVDINRNKGRVMAEESKQPIEEVWLQPHFFFSKENAFSENEKEGLSAIQLGLTVKYVYQKQHGNAAFF